jgi:starch synthase
VAGALPAALAGLGHDLSVFTPRYRATTPGPVLADGHSVTVPLAAGFRFADVQDGGKDRGVRHYLVDCPEFFDRPGLYQEDGKDYPDNAERFAGFCLAALEYMKRLPEPAEVIHCHDWQTALVPIYLHSRYGADRFFQNSGVVFTIHNLGYQGLFPPYLLPHLSLDISLLTVDALEFFGRVNLMKGAILFSDLVTTVSRKYAEEIQTAEFGFGLEGVLRRRADRLQGIVNGVDYSVWNPATDPLIAANYSPENLAGKIACKRALLETAGAADIRLDRPVVGLVSRFDSGKGFDLIEKVAENLLSLDVYLIMLGTGDPGYERFFQHLAARHPGKCMVRIGYDNALAHQIEAGSDIFLMPSRYEPCGLNQMYSLKYGTVPVVRATGGLDDSVEAFDGESGTGFKFVKYTPEALFTTLRQALETYRQRELWQRVMLIAMVQDFSWSTSARQYAAVYEKAGQLGAARHGNP